MDSSGSNFRRVTYSPPDRTAINPDWQPADTSGVPVYLTRLLCTKGGDSVRLVWGVTQDAVASGIYFLRFRAGKLIQSQKLVLVR